MPAVRNNQSVHGSSPYSASSSATITPSTKDKINTKPRSVLTEAQKAHLVAAAMEAAQKHMDFDQLSQTLGVSRAQLRQQFVPNRGNLRRSLEQLYK